MFASILTVMARGAGNTYENTVRMLNLMALLSHTNVPLTIDQIADMLSEVEPRFRYPAPGQARRAAFNRDKKALMKIGVPVLTSWLGGDKAGVGAYIIDKDKYVSVDFGLNRDEMDALQAAAAIVQIEQPWLKSAVQWVGGASEVAPGSTVAQLAGAGPALAFFTAAQERRKAKFRYNGIARTLRPYGIANNGGVWYVVGYDEARKDERNFRIDRLQSEPAFGKPNEFERPKDFDINTVLVLDAKLFGDGAREHAIVRVDANLASAVVAELGDDAVVSIMEGSGAVEVRVACGNYGAFRTWLFAMVDRAVVIGPEHIRDRIVADLQAMGAGE